MAPKAKQAARRAKAKAKPRAKAAAAPQERSPHRPDAPMIVNNLVPHMRRHFQQMVDDGPSHLDFPARCARAFDQLKDTHIWHLLAAKLDLQSPADDTEFERKLREFRACGDNYEPSIEDDFPLFRGKAPDNHPHPLAFSDDVQNLNIVGSMMHRECDVGRRMASDLLREDPDEFHRLLIVADRARDGGGAIIVGGRGEIDWNRASKGVGKGFSAFSGRGQRLGE